MEPHTTLIVIPSHIACSGDYSSFSATYVLDAVLRSAPACGPRRPSTDRFRGACLHEGLRRLLVILGSREMAASRGKMPPAPRHPTLHELFEPQAGAMVNLANVTAARGLHGPWESFRCDIWTCHQESASHSTHMTRSRNSRKILPFRQISRDLA